jgi:signal transduction histidine kinase/YHS domain-containing protein
MTQLTIDETVLRALQQRAEQLARGELGELGQAVCDVPALEDLRRAIDVLGAHTTQGLQHQHAYIAALSTAQEAERGRLARELHDEVVQQLVALGHSVDRVQRLLERGEGERAVERLHTMRGSLTALVGELRNVIGDLRPPALEELGLLPAVELLLQRGGEGAPEVALLVQGEERRLAPQSELALFRIIQEAWNNIRRHAHASHVDVTFRYTADGLAVRIVDDGIGFTPPRDDVAPDGHWGVRGMRERAELTGGQIDLVSAPGQGTTLTVRIPYPGVGGRDPVCGMRVGPEALGAEHDGALYRFCSPACRDLFRTRPHHYVAPA